jgi:hypothetical protein
MALSPKYQSLLDKLLLEFESSIEKMTAEQLLAKFTNTNPLVSCNAFFQSDLQNLDLEPWRLQPTEVFDEPDKNPTFTRVKGATSSLFRFNKSSISILNNYAS